MKKRLLATIRVMAAALAVLLLASAARAATVGLFFSVPTCGTYPDDPTKSCPYYFDCSSGALICCMCPPDPGNPDCGCSLTGLGLFAGGPGGAPVYLAGNWNRASGPGGVLRNLVEDINGKPVTTSATVAWEATGANFSESGVGFTDDPTTGYNKTLMSSYLDQNTDVPFPLFIRFDGLPDDLAAGYDVVIYTLVTVPGLGGEYTVNGSAPAFVLAGGNGVFNGPDFVEVPFADDPAFGVRDWGNYVVFRGLSGPTVTITATHGAKGHSPVNAVQIVSR